MNKFVGFKRFLEDTFTEPWTRTVKRQYGAENKTNPLQIVLNRIVLTKGDQKFTILPGTTIEKLTTDDNDSVDPKKTSVRIRIKSESDPKDPLMPLHGHGQPSQAAGQEFVVTRDVYNWLIQPGQSPAAPGTGMPPAGGTTPPATA